jgi:electron transfer flavoprotein beta subunit
MAPMIAELLGLPSISMVSALTIDGNLIKAERDIEGGKEVLESSLPCVISAQKGLNNPRYPKLPDIMKAKSKPIEEIPSLSTHVRISTMAMQLPISKRIGKISGDSESDISDIVLALHEEAKVI